MGTVGSADLMMSKVCCYKISYKKRSMIRITYSVKMEGVRPRQLVIGRNRKLDHGVIARKRVD